MTKKEYMNFIFSFANYPVDGFMMLQLILPVFAVMIVIPFLNAKSLFAFSFTRVSLYKNYLVKLIFKYLFVGCSVLFLAHLIFLFIGVAILPIKEDIGVPRELFSEIFGKDFYNQHMVLYFVLEGFLKFFIFPFVYGLFAVSISFLTEKKYLCLLIPLVYFSVLAIFVSVLESVFIMDLLFLSPTYTLMSNSRPYINGFVILAPLLPPLIFSIAVILRDFKKKSKRGDAFAIT